jgi:hypothetical protein
MPAFRSDEVAVSQRAQQILSEVSGDNGVPLPCLRVMVRRAMPSFSANRLVERPKAEATCSNMAAGNPLCAESRNGELRPSGGRIRGPGMHALRTASRVSGLQPARVRP